MIWNKKTKKYLSSDRYFCTKSLGIKDSNGQIVHDYDIVRIGTIIYHIELRNFSYIFVDKLTNTNKKINPKEVITIIGNTIE